MRRKRSFIPTLVIAVAALALPPHAAWLFPSIVTRTLRSESEPAENERPEHGAHLSYLTPIAGPRVRRRDGELDRRVVAFPAFPERVVAPAPVFPERAIRPGAEHGLRNGTGTPLLL